MLKWIIDTTMNDRLHPGAISIGAACKQLNIPHFETPYAKFRDKAWANAVLEASGFDEYDQVLAYGPHQFVSAIRRYIPTWVPGGYITYDNLCYSGYSPHYGELMLNSDYVLLPWGEFVRRAQRGDWDYQSIFIRPNAVTKSFTGTVIKRGTIQHEIFCIGQLQLPRPDELIVVASDKGILGEFRFVIANGEVVSYSEYRWDDVLDIRIDAPESCIELANLVAKATFKPEIAYVCDIALTHAGAKIIELNTFQCAGLYLCDTVKVVEAVTKAFEEESL